MALKVTTATDVIKVDTLCFTVYAQPGLGKTSLAFTAPRPLLLDFDKGAHRAVDRKDTVQVSQWSDVAGITASDVASYDTIVIDTVGKAIDTLAQDIIRSNSRLSHGGALSQQGWGQLGVRFSAFLKLLRGFGKDVILIAHMDEQKDGDVTKERLKIPGGSKDLILTDSDVIARVSIIGRQRYLVFSPTETAFGKDPAEIGEATIPDTGSPEYSAFIAGIIARIKGRLNALSEAQAAHKAETEWFAENLPKLVSAEQINGVLARAKAAGRDVAKLVAERAKTLGMTFNKDGGEYIVPKAEKPDEKPQGTERTAEPRDPEPGEKGIKAMLLFAIGLAVTEDDLNDWYKDSKTQAELDELEPVDIEDVRKAWSARRNALCASAQGHQEAA
ncbi:hypothetical protein FHS82_001005 [Pseudochelatococcus lubricantis]|uniref:ATP-binding protein n=1 Tax=Pseudochelatococcus lubricantis TaxID=1538102 RepID=A0ABX0UY10_9HYPH|nr:ATP-binding protein [Pseudochelatococcus lubricantis]NIJ57179.1 hypothetical protein [Pseudochelatococcus lubricantis]